MQADGREESLAVLQVEPNSTLSKKLAGMRWQSLDV
jgi:hypothetical protein